MWIGVDLCVQPNKASRFAISSSNKTKFEQLEAYTVNEHMYLFLLLFVQTHRYRSFSIGTELNFPCKASNNSSTDKY